MKKLINGFIHSTRLQDYESTESADVFDRHRFSFFVSEDLKFLNYVYVCPYTLEFEIPATWNPTKTEIEILRAKREEFAKKMQEEMQTKLFLMDIEISKLQCLEYDEPESNL